MRKFLLIAALLLVPLGAMAGQNIQQRSHGGAVWVQTRDSTINPAGDTGVVTEITNVTNAVTKYLLAPKTGNITRVYSVLSAALTGSNAVFAIRANNADVLAAGESFTNTGHSVTIATSGSAAGTVDSSILSPTTATKVTQGDVIAIISTGGSGGGAGGAQFTIFIE